MLGGRRMTAAYYYGDLTSKAQELVRLERSGKPFNKEDFDCGCVDTCIQCHQMMMPPKKILRCSRCKGVLYCSKEVRFPSPELDKRTDARRSVVCNRSLVQA